MRAAPPWIAAANLPSGAPTRPWTAEVEGNLTCTDIELEMSVRNISQSARAALTLGTLEWVIYRFADQFGDERPHQFLDAAWAVLADPSHVKLDSYLDSWDIYDDDPSFYKPVDLAFWYACESVYAVSLGRWMFEAPGAGLRIARWVNDDTESVATWWRTILTRLEQDQAFCPYVEFNDNEWRGPIRGPLHVVMALYNDALHFEDADQEENAAWICQLAELVLPSTDSFHAWLDAVISRLEEWFPAPDEDEFDFAYDWQAEEPFCPRECFDPAFTFDPADAPGLITAFLATIEDHNNPFMRAPSQLQDAGIEGVPYPER